MASVLMCRSEDSYWNQFSPSAMWYLGTESKLLDLVTSTFTYQTIFLSLYLSSEEYFGKKIVLVSPLINVPKSCVNV